MPLSWLSIDILTSSEVLVIGIWIYFLSIITRSFISFKFNLQFSGHINKYPSFLIYFILFEFSLIVPLNIFGSYKFPKFILIFISPEPLLVPLI